MCWVLITEGDGLLHRVVSEGLNLDENTVDHNLALTPKAYFLLNFSNLLVQTVAGDWCSLNPSNPQSEKLWDKKAISPTACTQLSSLLLAAKPGCIPLDISFHNRKLDASPSIMLLNQVCPQPV